MACQIHATHSYPNDQQHAEADRQADEAAVQAAEHASDVTVEDADQWLDEIDAVLEQNALEFVNAYVQKPGQ